MYHVGPLLAVGYSSFIPHLSVPPSLRGTGSSSVAGSPDDSFTVISKVSDAVSPVESVAVRVTV